MDDLFILRMTVTPKLWMHELDILSAIYLIIFNQSWEWVQKDDLFP